jgi:hypothetical protein
VGFSRASFAVRETDTAARITLWRFNPRAGELQVKYRILPESAVADEDFVAPVDTTVDFAAGATSAVVYLPIVLDNIAEAEESFAIALDDAGDIAGVNRRVTVRILDGNQGRDAR